MQLLAFSGYARTGKDEASKALEPLEFHRIAFADKLREFLTALDPYVAPNVRLSNVLKVYGWDGYKGSEFGFEVRRLLQRLGTECGRNLMGENVWVDATLDNLDPNGRYVITDCRFPNEAQAVKDRGGYLYRIVRPGVGPANDHPSETSLDDWDFDGVVINDSTRNAYHASVQRLAGTLFDGQRFSTVE